MVKKSSKTIGTKRDEELYQEAILFIRRYMKEMDNRHLRKKKK